MRLYIVSRQDARRNPEVRLQWRRIDVKKPEIGVEGSLAVTSLRLMCTTAPYFDVLSFSFPFFPIVGRGPQSVDPVLVLCEECRQARKKIIMFFSHVWLSAHGGSRNVSGAVVELKDLKAVPKLLYYTL